MVLSQLESMLTNGSVHQSVASVQGGDESTHLWVDLQPANKYCRRFYFVKTNFMAPVTVPGVNVPLLYVPFNFFTREHRPDNERQNRTIGVFLSQCRNTL